MGIVIGPAGVFVAGKRGNELREQARDARARLDAAGLAAVPAVAVPGRDDAYAQMLADADTRFPSVIMRRVERALEIPPPWVATVSDAADTRTPRTSAQPSARTSR